MPSFVTTLRRIGNDVGLAFQIQDDLLDETTTAKQLGKTPGKNKEEGKATWPAAVGAAEARRRADALLSRSLAALAALGPAAARLTALVERTAGRAS